MIQSIVLLLAFVATAGGIASWAARVRRSYLEAAHFTKEFVELTREILDDSETPQVSKNMLLSVAPYIGDAELAKWASRVGSHNPQTERNRAWKEIDAIADPERKQRIYWAMLLFMMALSHRDRSQGWRLRERLLGHGGERSVKPPSCEVFEVIHAKGLPAMAPA